MLKLLKYLQKNHPKTDSDGKGISQRCKYGVSPTTKRSLIFFGGKLRKKSETTCPQIRWNPARWNVECWHRWTSSRLATLLFRHQKNMVGCCLGWFGCWWIGCFFCFFIFFLLFFSFFFFFFFLFSSVIFPEVQWTTVVDGGMVAPAKGTLMLGDGGLVFLRG